MRIRIGNDGELSAAEPDADSAELTDLFADWLAQDRDVGPHVTIRRIRSAPVEGAMSGELLDWISLTLNTGLAAANLIYSHLNFRAALPPRRRRGARMVIEHNGVRLVIEDGTAEEAARLVRLLASTTDGAGDGAGGGGDGGARTGDGAGEGS